jgi:hypothetical protein
MTLIYNNMIYNNTNKNNTQQPRKGYRPPSGQLLDYVATAISAAQPTTRKVSMVYNILNARLDDNKPFLCPTHVPPSHRRTSTMFSSEMSLSPTSTTSTEEGNFRQPFQSFDTGYYYDVFEENEPAACFPTEPKTIPRAQQSMFAQQRDLARTHASSALSKESLLYCLDGNVFGTKAKEEQHKMKEEDHDEDDDMMFDMEM